jgi:hypothetical protein
MLSAVAPHAIALSMAAAMIRIFRDMYLAFLTDDHA